MDAPVPEGLRQVGDHLVDTDSWARWGQNLADAVDAHHTAKPLEAGLSVEAARRWLGLADIRLVEALVRDSVGRLTARSGRVARPGSGPSFSEETGRALDDIRQRLERDPLAAPEAQELAAAGLTKERPRSGRHRRAGSAAARGGDPASLGARESNGHDRPA